MAPRVTTLPTREIARTGIRLTELGFGAANLGNLYSVTADEDAAASVETAWACGIRYFDTAPHYGLGLSERRLAGSLAAYPRDQFIISTKVGRLIVPNEMPTARDVDFVVPGDMRREWDFSRDGVLRSVEASLARLDLDRIDILYLHDPDLAPAADAAITGAAALIELREQGVVRAVGIGSNDARAIATCFQQSDIDMAMVAGRFTALEHRDADEMFEAAAGRTVVAAGVFNSGILAQSRPGPGAMYNYEPAPQEVLDRANQLADIAEANGATLPQLAIRFPLQNPQVASVVLGMRTSAQVTRNVAIYEPPIDPRVWAQIN